MGITRHIPVGKESTLALDRAHINKTANCVTRSPFTGAHWETEIEGDLKHIAKIIKRQMNNMERTWRKLQEKAKYRKAWCELIEG